VTKKDIVRTISEEVGLTQQQTKEVVQKTFDAIIESLVREQRIELRNFGVFEVKPRAARKARNPRTGEQVDVPRKHVVTFKPGKYMEAKVRALDEAEIRRVLGLSVNEINQQRNDDQGSTSSESPSGRWDL
jgi:nucleoid DNA-binding protein